MEFRNTLNFILALGVVYLAVNSTALIYNVFVVFSLTILQIKLAAWFMEKTRKYILYKKVCPNNKTILITGCDSGFGNALARRMDKLGYFVYATCLDPDGEGAKMLSKECSKNLVVLRMDVTDDGSIQEAKEYVERNLKENGLWAVINNAGILHFSEVDWTSFEELHQVYNVNAAGTLRVTKAFLPHIKKAKGRFVNLTSSAGCDTGFGNALARRLDKLGFTVFATCLDPNGAGAKNLLKECSENMKVLAMDVTDDGSIQKVKEFVGKNLGQNVLWAVVNNAGIAQVGEIDWTSVEEIQKVYNVNAVGTLRVTKCFLSFLKKSRGRIVNVTSHAGRHTSPVYVGYCMSKSAGIALTNGLRVELAKWGMKAISIEPYFYATRMTDLRAALGNADRTWKSAPEEIKEEYGEGYIEGFKTCIIRSRFLMNSKTNQVVDCLEDAVIAKEPLSTYSPGNLMFRFLYEISPSSIMDYVQKIVLDTGGKPLDLISNKKKE